MRRGLVSPSPHQTGALGAGRAGGVPRRSGGRRRARDRAVDPRDARAWIDAARQMRCAMRKRR
eukprot:7879240-Pyramimonas_sp.AAC.1